MLTAAALSKPQGHSIAGRQVTAPHDVVARFRLDAADIVRRFMQEAEAPVPVRLAAPPRTQESSTADARQPFEVEPNWQTWPSTQIDRSCNAAVVKTNLSSASVPASSRKVRRGDSDFRKHDDLMACGLASASLSSSAAPRGSGSMSTLDAPRALHGSAEQAGIDVHTSSRYGTSDRGDICYASSFDEKARFSAPGITRCHGQATEPLIPYKTASASQADLIPERTRGKWGNEATSAGEFTFERGFGIMTEDTKRGWGRDWEAADAATALSAFTMPEMDAQTTAFSRDSSLQFPWAKQTSATTQSPGWGQPQSGSVLAGAPQDWGATAAAMSFQRAGHCTAGGHQGCSPEDWAVKWPPFFVEAAQQPRHDSDGSGRGWLCEGSPLRAFDANPQVLHSDPAADQSVFNWAAATRDQAIVGFSSSVHLEQESAVRPMNTVGRHRVQGENLPELSHIHAPDAQADTSRGSSPNLGFFCTQFLGRSLDGGNDIDARCRDDARQDGSHERIDGAADDVAHHLLCARDKIEATEAEFARIMNELVAYGQRQPAGQETQSGMYKASPEYFSISTPVPPLMGYLSVA